MEQVLVLGLLLCVHIFLLFHIRLLLSLLVGSFFLLLLRLLCPLLLLFLCYPFYILFPLFLFLLLLGLLLPHLLLFVHLAFLVFYIMHLLRFLRYLLPGILCFLFLLLYLIPHFLEFLVCLGLWNFGNCCIGTFRFRGMFFIKSDMSIAFVILHLPLPVILSFLPIVFIFSRIIVSFFSLADAIPCKHSCRSSSNYYHPHILPPLSLLIYFYYTICFAFFQYG